ncbi:MAG: MFS transporter [Clostridiales Family XIII bacterium]|nr:MFS transporter [Clostridiales Family XIII bacterium]
MEQKDNWIKNTILFLSSQTISIFGSFLVQYAILWYITLTSRSGIMMTIYIISTLVPVLFVSPFAGVWADRFDRKKLIMLSDSFIAFVTLILAILFYTGHGTLWILIIAAAFRSLGGAVQMPVVGAFLPQIVPSEKLMRVNGINSSIQSLVMLGSPMLSGALLSFASIEAIFFIDVCTALTAVGFLGLFLKIPPREKTGEEEKINYFRDLKEGFRYIGSQRYLRDFFILLAILYFLIAPVSFLTPLQVTRSFGAHVWRLTAIELIFSVGMMLGGILIASWTGFKNKIHTIILGFLVFALSTVGLGVVFNFWIYLSFMCLAGVAMSLFSTPATVLLQQRVDESYIGRVFGVMTMISGMMTPLGMLFFGPLGDVIPIEWILIATGLLMVIEGFILLGNKALLEAGKPIEESDK